MLFYCRILFTEVGHLPLYTSKMTKPGWSVAHASFVLHQNMAQLFFWIAFHCLLICPMIIRASDVSTMGKLKLWKTCFCFTSINQLDWQKISRESSSKYPCKLALVINCYHFNSFCSLLLHSPIRTRHNL